MLTKSIDAFLKKYSINNKTVLVAFSGGYDSLCLLDVINKQKEKYSITPIAIHLNHNWRKEESAQEATNCQNFCNKNNITFYTETLNPEIPQTETAAREARYAFFEKCAQMYNTNIVMTAHNADDNAETLIYRISKGTGTVGLKGIQEVRGIYYRPLLTTYRKDIETYCNNNHLSPNIDSSNSDTKYRRNHIRQNILPELEKINIEAKKAINNLSKIAILDNEIINEYLNLLEDKYDTAKFIQFSEAVQSRIIYNLLNENNIEYNQKTINKILNFISENKNTKNGKTLSLTNKEWLFVNKKEIRIIQDNHQTNTEIIIKKCSRLPEKFPLDSELMAYADLSEVNDELTIRTRNKGDIIYPLGAKGKQKLKKYMNEKGIPKDKRDILPLIALNNEILWVPGFGISEKIKIKTKPTHILKLEQKNEY